MWVEDVKVCDDRCCEEWIECKTDDAIMLEETKHDQIWRHDNDFDKTTREFVDAFKNNATGHAQEHRQVVIERSALHLTV